MSTRISFNDRLTYAFRRFLGTPIHSDLDRHRIVARDAAMHAFSTIDDAGLRSTAQRFSKGAGPADGERADPATSLALAAEACRRFLSMEPYEEQLLAAAAMVSGSVAQMQTGEGKTLAAAIAACHCASRDGSVHVLTANDYLAARDAEWMRPVFEGLGFSVASIASSDPPGKRRQAYAADVVYLTARELGFDYLRDGLAFDPADTVQGEFRSAIVDEADFILIDEARVPLVIAGTTAESCPADMVQEADRAVRTLVRGADFLVDPEGRRVSLSPAGQKKVEALMGTGGMHEVESSPVFARVHASLHARVLLTRDVDYVVKDGKAKLVDPFTGRVAADRQWPWGIQAAVEAKEGLQRGPEGRVYGSITVQYLMGLFPRLAAMTATAVSAAEEFSASYGMETVVIPPARPSMRQDEPDRVFWTREAKLRALAEEVRAEHGRGRPILIGTVSVRESEELAGTLEDAGIPCVVLNARNDEEEARLVAAAGRLGAVTVSTNMAGRGTDIRLGDGARELGGLYVIGTNRHQSRRIDDQLRGRSGRQGDPGLSRFFVSLEDELFERYGGRDILPEPYRTGPPSGNPAGTGGRYGEPITEPTVLREVQRAQSIVEAVNSRIRRSLKKLFIIMEFDRRYVRELRDDALIHGILPPEVELALSSVADPVPPRIRALLVQTFLAKLDALWADQLGLAEDVKEGLGLHRYGGREPGIEFIRLMGDAFERAMGEFVSACIDDGLAALAGQAIDLRGEGVAARPSSTWTYVVEDDQLPGFRIGAFSGAAAFALGPLALPLFLLELTASKARKAGKPGAARNRS